MYTNSERFAIVARTSELMGPTFIAVKKVLTNESIVEYPVFGLTGKSTAGSTGYIVSGRKRSFLKTVRDAASCGRTPGG